MGNGQAIYDSSLNRYFINLGINVRYDAESVGDLIRWQRCFDHVSQILFDLSNGQMQLGTLSFLNSGPPGTTDGVSMIYGIGEFTERLDALSRSSKWVTYQTFPIANETALDTRSRKIVDLSTGWYTSEIRLEPGSCIAIFRASQNGRAIYASNPEGSVDRHPVTNDLQRIPTFTRIEKHRFQVPK